MDWFKGKSTGNQSLSHEIKGFPVKFPLNQSIASKHISCQITNHNRNGYERRTPTYNTKSEMAALSHAYENKTVVVEICPKKIQKR